jgi:hypothetical protein
MVPDCGSAGNLPSWNATLIVHCPPGGTAPQLASGVAVKLTPLEVSSGDAVTFVTCSVPLPVFIAVTSTGSGGREQSPFGQAVKFTVDGDSDMPAKTTGIACEAFAAFGASTLTVAEGGAVSVEVAVAPLKPTITLQLEP